jgi:hypothetical protein
MPAEQVRSTRLTWEGTVGRFSGVRFELDREDSANLGSWRMTQLVIDNHSAQALFSTTLIESNPEFGRGLPTNSQKIKVKKYFIRQRSRGA